MKYTPQELVEYIKEEKLEHEFFQALMQYKKGYSIAEITDRRFEEKNGIYYMQSEMFALDLEIKEEDIIAAIINKLYLSAFLSRYEDVYQIHFLVHQYPERMKGRFEEEITNEVIYYMILQAIVTLRLDTKGKIKAYIEKN